MTSEWSVTFGKDEVNEAIKVNGGVFSNAFWLALDDYSIDTFNSLKVAIPTPTGLFASRWGSSVGICSTIKNEFAHLAPITQPR